MALLVQIPTTTAGVLAAAACVVAGAPWFADGLRAIRTRRLLAQLSDSPPRDANSGPVQMQGTVALESPLWSPLSGRPCAGFVLEGIGVDVPVHARVTEQRTFRLDAENASAHIEGGEAELHLSVTSERLLAPREAVSAHVAALLARQPELHWLRERGRALRLTERALFAGARVHVLGTAIARARWQDTATTLRTGTDGAVQVVENAPQVAMTIGVADPLGLLVVSDAEPRPRELAPSRLRELGAALGPVLTLGGLLYLARAAEIALGGGL